MNYWTLAGCGNPEFVASWAEVWGMVVTSRTCSWVISGSSLLGLSPLTCTNWVVSIRIKLICRTNSQVGVRELILEHTTLAHFLFTKGMEVIAAFLSIFFFLPPPPIYREWPGFIGHGKSTWSPPRQNTNVSWTLAVHWKLRAFRSPTSQWRRVGSSTWR